MLSSETGFTIVESLVAATIGMVVIGGLASSLATMSNIQHSVSLASDSVSIVDQISNGLKVGNQCSLVMKNAGVNLGPYFLSGAPKTNFSLQMPIDGQMATLQENMTSDVVPGVRIKQFRLLRNMNAGTATIPTTTSGVNYTEFQATLRVQPQRVANGVTTDLATHDIPLKFVTDAANNVVMCNSQASVVRNCAESGGAWDPVKSTCAAKSTIKFGGSYSQTTGTDQGGFVNELTGGYSCLPGYTAVRSGSMAYTVSCNNKNICDHFYPIYSCVQYGGSIGYAQALPSTQEFGTGSDVTDAINSVDATSSQVSTANTVAGGAKGGGGGGGCFIAGSQVSLSDGSSKSIEDVKIGDQLISIDERTMAPYVSTVTRTLHHDPSAQRLYEFILEDGYSFTANGVHPLYVSDLKDYSSVSKIYERAQGGASTSLRTASGASVKILAVRRYDAFEPVYNLHVSGFADEGKYNAEGAGHNYLVGGILVHNATTSKK